MSDDDRPENPENKPSIANIRGLPAPNPTEIEKQVAAYRRNENAVLEFYDINARIQRSRYLALRKEGFTPLEAIELCKT